MPQNIPAWPNCLQPQKFSGPRSGLVRDFRYLQNNANLTPNMESKIDNHLPRNAVAYCFDGLPESVEADYDSIHGSDRIAIRKQWQLHLRRSWWHAAVV
jgi:hypothetical protein